MSQQQGGGNSLTFSSQFETLSTLNLPLISGPGKQSDHENFAKESTSEKPPAQPSDETSPAAPTQGVIKLLENLGQLRDAGILTEEEFTSKKAEILARI